MKKLAGLLLTIPILAACAAEPGQPAESEGPIPSRDITTPSQAARPSLGADGVPEGLLEDVLTLAEDETGVDRSEIDVVVAEAVTWGDGSIGCPQEGMSYTQALVPGYRVVLDIAGDELAFHAPESGEFSPCADPIEPVDGSPDS